jgi:hypothetical protein
MLALGVLAMGAATGAAVLGGCVAIVVWSLRRRQA